MKIKTDQYVGFQTQMFKSMLIIFKHTQTKNSLKEMKDAQSKITEVKTKIKTSKWD